MNTVKDRLMELLNEFGIILSFSTLAYADSTEEWSSAFTVAYTAVILSSSVLVVIISLCKYQSQLITS
jgi:hypothetical protein